MARAKGKAIAEPLAATPAAEMARAARIPFSLGSQEAAACFDKWRHEESFTPNGFAEEASLDELRPAFVPARRLRGVAKVSFHGETAGKRRKTHECGTLRHEFDVVVPACGEVPTELFQKLGEWPLDRRMAAGTPLEFPALAEDDEGRAHQRAEEVVGATLEEVIRRHIGKGDKSRGRVISREAAYEFASSERVLLPIYLADYSFRMRRYRSFIHGTSGRAAGASPTSWVKVALAAGVALAVVGGLIWLVVPASVIELEVVGLVLSGLGALAFFVAPNLWRALLGPRAH